MAQMVGVDDVKLQMMDKLTNNCLDLQIIPIVGMGGTGKTTLARNIYQERLIMEHFDICAWTTISQEYNIRDLLAEVLAQLIAEKVNQDLNEHELGGRLYKHLYGRRYLIIMDDMWSIEAWDRVRNYFPNNNNGSRIVVTTRLSNLASTLPNSDSIRTELLDEANSWELLSKTVFGEKKCPLELEQVGKKIGKSCRGLPLSIVVVGGLLAKSEHTTEYWEYIEENLNSIVNLEDDERCLKLLHLSYKQLPIYLKPCFLYMGTFPEDASISTAWLMKLWVAEGFLKPVTGKSLEEVAQEYFKDLCDRNLVLIHKIGIMGNIKHCKIHDLLRDLCLREAQKERFYTPPRFFAIPATKEEAAQPVSRARSAIRGFTGAPPPPHTSRLLRVYRDTNSSPSLENSLEFVNLRLVGPISLANHELESPIYRFWNLQTLSIAGGGVVPIEIWFMPQIRHVRCRGLRLSDPPIVDDVDEVVLGDLHTLEIRDFRCSEEVVKRIPNIKKLVIFCSKLDERSRLDNLASLQKLQTLHCEFDFDRPQSLQSLSFPHSIKNLWIELSSVSSWQEIMEKIGTLPLLEKLKLYNGSFEDGEWDTVEGQFRSLKFLEIVGSDLEVMRIESSHFPCLEHLILRKLKRLYDIPLEVAEISTLRLIFLECYEAAALVCLKKIVDEQEELFGEVGVKMVANVKRGRVGAHRERWSSPHIDTQQGRVWMQQRTEYSKWG
ncbi:putative late blight resistance protein homolog R1B-16 isoform X3 [Salvia miltiorrhiza]|uniref:putative late blight resistance protein homolog R1B-16 isoform X3 n=1 Tax=Salvia miltiorrhiza TaxID=226208 RepID=UPI0025AC7F73|nr:putative late blight resistance protein homolog R1B-16 isoform X3 [Salvia miltiorrhiza]